MGKSLNLSKQAKAWQIMLYVEQIGITEELTREQKIIKLKEFLNSLKFDRGLFYGILHYKELVTKLFDEENFVEEYEEPHLHLVFYTTNQYRPSTILKDIGVIIKKENESLYTHGGFSYLNIKQHQVASSVIYLNHNSSPAKNENKILYEISDIVTNDTDIDWYIKYEKEYATYIDGTYVNKYGQIQQLHEDNELFDYLDASFNYGYDLKDFELFINEIPRRYKYKYYDKLEKYYYQGVDKRYNDKMNTDVCRVSIFIQGTYECGKSYASKMALLDMNRKVEIIGASSGTGAEDNVKPTDCLIYDDRIPKFCLDKADTYMCRTYRRGSHNGIFAGDFFIMNYNSSFEESFKSYYKDKGDDITELSDQAKAVKTRLFIIKIETGKVKILQRCMRGTPEQIRERNKKFEEFLTYFKKYILQKFEMDKDKPHYIEEDYNYEEF